MVQVTGIGGVFIYSNNPKSLAEWYANHFGIEFGADEKEENFWMLFHSRDDNEPSKRTNTVFAIMLAKTPLGPRHGEYMINYRVDDLQGFIEQLKTKGVNTEPVQDDGQIGKFTWITDPDGNRIELYQPY